jgi:hypothetical protein
LEPARHGNRLAPIGCLAANVQTGLSVEYLPNPPPHDLVFVSQEHADHTWSRAELLIHLSLARREPVENA